MVDILDVVVVVNLINEAVGHVLRGDDAADDDLAVYAIDALLVGNDDENDVDSVDNEMCEVIPVDVVVDDVRVVDVQVVDDDNGNDDRDAARRDLMHAKEKAS